MRESADRAGEGHVLNALGTALARTGEKRKALECFEQAFQAMSDLQDRRRAASMAGNMGVTYSDLGEYQRALDSAESCTRTAPSHEESRRRGHRVE